MKATISKECTGKANFSLEKKEKIKTYIGISGKQELVRINLYMGRSANASTVYCNLWVGNNIWANRGTGQAKGWGYDKQSAAVSEALRDAGIELDKDISGVGYTAIREAMTAVMESLGFSDSFILEA